MQITGHIEVTPIGVGESIRQPVERAIDLIREAGVVTPTVSDDGTSLQGELADVLSAVERVHLTLHASGVPRLTTTLTIQSRTGHD